MSLIELLVALSILGIMATTMSVLLVSTLRSQSLSAQQGELLQTARLAMERMVLHVERANRVLLPLASKPTRDILALGGFIDNDGDDLFDEDPPVGMTLDGKAGMGVALILTIDSLSVFAQRNDLVRQRHRLLVRLDE